MEKFLKLKWTMIWFIITMATVSDVSSQNIISPAQWEESALNQEQTTRFNKILSSVQTISAEPNSEVFDIIKIDISPISSIVNNRITIDIPGSNYPASTFKGKHVEYVSDSDYSWYGEIDIPLGDNSSDIRYGTLLLMAKGGEKFGQIKLEDEDYSIEDIGGKNLLLKYSGSDIGICGGAIDDPEFQEDPGGEAEERTTNCEMTILVLYTEKAETRVNSIFSTIQKSINYTNQAFINSSTSSCDFSLDLVAYEQIDIDESFKDFSFVLDEVRDDPVAKARRNHHDADLVVLLVDRVAMAYESTRGIAVLGPSGGHAYAVVDSWTANKGGLAFAHEVGHLIGCRHEICSATLATPNCDNFLAFPEHAHTWNYLAGSSNYQVNVQKQTIMYGDFNPNQVQHFSNPDIEIDGHSTGIADEIDNHRKLEERSCHVANFKTQTDILVANIEGTNIACPNDYVSLSSNVSGTQGPYTYEWKISTNSGLNWDILPVFSTNSQIGITTSLLNLNYGDVIYVRLNVVSENDLPWISNTYTDYHAIEISNEGELPCPHSINNLGEIESYFSVYPNPSKATTTLSFSLLVESTVQINVYDLSGKIVKSFNKGSLSIGSHQENIDFSSNESSVYFIELIRGNERERIPFTLIK